MKAILYSLVGLLLLAPEAAMAQSTSGRERGNVTGWALRYGASAATINTDTGNGLRVIDIERVGSDQYDVTYVSNSGVYRDTDPHVYFSQSQSTLSLNLSLSGRRILDLETIDNGSSNLYYATTVDNTGSAAAGWTWIVNQTSAQLFAHLAANPTLRPIDIDRYIVDGTPVYSMVTVQNTGVHQRTWSMHIDRTVTQISDLLNANNARLVDLEVTSTLPLRFSCIMVNNDGVPWWWYPAATTADIDFLLANNGARPIHVQKYTSATGDPRYAVIMVNNSNSLTYNIGETMRQGITNGTVGLYLKQVGGPVLASLNSTRQFEPASTLKILYATRAVDICAAGIDSLSATLLNDDTCNPNECPDQNPGGCNSVTESVSAVIRRMLHISDNNATREIVTRFGGHATMSNYAGSVIGTAATLSRHNIGCPGCPLNPDLANRLTLADVGLIYERIADGSLFNESFQNTLYDLLEDSRNVAPGTTGSPNGAWTSFRNMINQEAAQTDLTDEEIESFIERSWHARKAGGYGCFTPDQAARSIAGWARIPFKSTTTGIITLREYVLGTFVDQTSDINGSNVCYSVFPELLHGLIRDALESWDDYCSPPAIINHPDDRTVLVNADATFRVITAISQISGAPTTYQWFRGTTPLNDGLHLGIGTISGSETSTLNLSNIRRTAGGEYSVRVTRSCGFDVSDRATLTVNSCAADFNGDGSRDPDDLADFITCFFLDVQFPGFCRDADFNNDTSRDPDDLADFITAFFLGC